MAFRAGEARKGWRDTNKTLAIGGLVDTLRN